MLGASDEDHFTFAQEEKRVSVTHDDDFCVWRPNRRSTLERIHAAETRYWRDCSRADALCGGAWPGRNARPRRVSVSGIPCHARYITHRPYYAKVKQSGQLS